MAVLGTSGPTDQCVLVSLLSNFSQAQFVSLTVGQIAAWCGSGSGG